MRAAVLPSSVRDEVVTRGEALEALRVWVLAEAAHGAGGVPDEVLTHLQDQVRRLLGPRAVPVAGEVLHEVAASGGDLFAFGRDDAAVADLLVRVEGTRRRGFESDWRAHVREALQAMPARPLDLLVMAEHAVGDPVWARPRGHGGPVVLGELGVSDLLVQRLRAWNERYEMTALTDFRWLGAETEATWVADGLELAHELQRELPDLDVRYLHADDDRPLREVER